MKELKLVVTALIKDVEKKDEKILKIEKENHFLKLAVESLSKENKQAEMVIQKWKCNRNVKSVILLLTQRQIWINIINQSIRKQ